ncbi:MAG: GNAT family N-acetyltransferase [Anaerolineae bacterium]
MIIRPAKRDDLRACFTIDNSYVTDYVWQMEEHATEGEITIAFREVRLPRTMRVSLSLDDDYLLENWKKGECFLVAEEKQEIKGYLDMTVQPWQRAGWINNMAVAKRLRRQGIGSALMQEAIRWAEQRRLRALMLETQTKNYPAISFYRKHGFVFCGFNDQYYTTNDIAVFFTRRL